MTSTGFVSLRGYAAPFYQAERYGERLEYFAHDAFDLETNGDVFLTFGTHEAIKISSPISLFVDGYGLGFIASITESTYRSIGTSLLRDAQYCSVSMVRYETENVQLDDGAWCSRIIDARIDHVTICAAPVYTGTGVWATEKLEALPPRLAALNSKFETGRAQWLRQRERAKESTNAMAAAAGRPSMIFGSSRAPAAALMRMRAVSAEFARQFRRS